jgi:hypothetical protein
MDAVGKTSDGLYRLIERIQMSCVRVLPHAKLSHVYISTCEVTRDGLFGVRRDGTRRYDD